MYGDQAIFVRRTVFQQIGGFPLQPILEDIGLSERLLKVGQSLILDSAAITDSRKFTQRGILRSFCEAGIILICHQFKLPIMGKGFFSAIR